jgi:hypothetical protein
MSYEERSKEAARRSIGDRLSGRLWSFKSRTQCEEAMCRSGLRDFDEPAIEPALSTCEMPIDEKNPISHSPCFWQGTRGSG